MKNPIHKFYQKMRFRAYQKGFRDGHKFGWERKLNPKVKVSKFYSPPFWFDEWYNFGFDSGAKLENE